MAVAASQRGDSGATVRMSKPSAAMMAGLARIHFQLSLPSESIAEPAM